MGASLSVAALELDPYLKLISRYHLHIEKSYQRHRPLF
jgi:hypothetical protein